MVVSKHDVHIWRTFLNQPEVYVQQLALTLSIDEQARAGQFHFEHDRRRYIVSHGLLRCILGSYLDIEPGQVQFHHGDYGKPMLAAPVVSGHNTLHFNMSHSHEMALYVVTYGREAGIDVEYIRHVPEVEQLVERFFSRAEKAAFRVLAPDERDAAFFKGWTRKEAYLKAIGTGLRTSLDVVEVSLFPHEPAALLNVKGNAQEVSRWSLQDLAPARGYAAALAVEGKDFQLSYCQLPYPVSS